MISDFVSLSDKLRRERLTLVSEERAFDAFLPVRPIFGSAPNKDCCAFVVSKDDLVPRANEEAVARALVAAGIVAPEQGVAGSIAVFREIPERAITHLAPSVLPFAASSRATRA